MSRNWIVVGDPTSSGGKVITGSPFTDIDGKSVTRVTDKATCPTHKGVFPIVDGDATIIIDGQPVALHGSKLACGCTVLSAQQMSVFVDTKNSATARATPSTAALAHPLQKNFGENAPSPVEKVPIEFDEQLQFVTDAGTELSNLEYTLYLDDGSKAQGTTDAQGKTRRVATKKPTKITKATLKPTTAKPPCCMPETASFDPEEHLIVIPVQAITHNEAIGTSIRQVKTNRGFSRGLTSGEIAMTKWVFGSSIDYSKVLVRNGDFWMLLGQQDQDTAVTPDGNMYWPNKHFRQDFSTESLIYQRWFMHEMTHVWQYQMGFPVMKRGMIRVGLNYNYTLSPTKKFGDYDMEAQGNIIADYFLVKFRSAPRFMYEEKYISSPQILQQLEQTLSDLAANPSAPTNLPPLL